MAKSGMRRRITLGGAVLAAGVLAAVTAANGVADTESPERSSAQGAVPSRSGSPTSTVDRVADFYGTYIDALHDSGRGRLADVLRGHYLTAALRHSLARWESTHHKDGVLRAKGVPTAWKVLYNDSGMGRCWSRVILTWKDSGNHVHHTRLMVQSDLDTRLISGIKTDTLPPNDAMPRRHDRTEEVPRWSAPGFVGHHGAHGGVRAEGVGEAH